MAGYAAFNDISARDVIRSENKTGIHLMGKSFPGFAPMGPYLVTADEIPDPQSLKLKLSVNGEVRQNSNLGYMIFNIRAMIAYWSQMGLNPGDVLTTGTPRGVAAGRKPDQVPWWLKPGDLVEAEVEKVGCLRNRIVSGMIGFAICTQKEIRHVIVFNIGHSAHGSRSRSQRMPLPGRNDSGVIPYFGARAGRPPQRRGNHETPEYRLEVDPS